MPALDHPVPPLPCRLGALTAIVLNLLLPDEKGLTVPEPDTPDLSIQGAEPSVRYSSKPLGKDPLHSQDTSMHMSKDYSTDMQKVCVCEGLPKSF